MKKINKLFCSALLSVTMLANITISATEKNDETNIIDDSIAYENYNRCIDEISLINSDIESLKIKNSNHEYDEYLFELNKRREYLYKEIKLYGGNTFDDKIMEDVFLNAYYPNSMQSRSLTDNELKKLLDQLKNDYSATGKQTSFSSGGKIYKVYEITVQSSGSVVSQSRLTSNKDKVVLYESPFNANSSTSKNFLNEIINIYISKGISTILEMVPGIKYLPYELAFPGNTASANEISSAGNTLSCSLHVGSVVRFSYVLNETNNSWVYCLASNKVIPKFTMTFNFYRGSVPYSSEPIVKREVIDGGINTSLSTAVTIFKSTSANSVSPTNLGINTVSYKTLYDGSISVNTCAPSAPIYLL